MHGDQGRFFNITGASIWMQLSVKKNLCWPFKKISKLKSSWEREDNKRPVKYSEGAMVLHNHGGSNLQGY